VYSTTEYGRPIRVNLWWRVVQVVGNQYNANRPDAGDAATSRGGGQWSTHGSSGPSGGVSTGTGSTQAEFREEVEVPPPASRGKELRWKDGQWEKLMASGWVPAGEGKGKEAAGKSRHHATRYKKSKAGSSYGGPQWGQDEGDPASPGVRSMSWGKTSAQLDAEIAEALAKSGASARSHSGKPKPLDGAALAEALPAYKGWTPAWEYPGFLAFHRGGLSVFCTPDHHRPGTIAIEVQNSDGTIVGSGRDLVWPMAKRTPASFMKLMRPVLEALAEKRASYPSGGGGRVVEGHGFVPHGSKSRGGRIVPGKGWVPNK
jgi:hypothetical protein